MGTSLGQAITYDGGGATYDMQSRAEIVGYNYTQDLSVATGNVATLNNITLTNVPSIRRIEIANSTSQYVFTPSANIVLEEVSVTGSNVNFMDISANPFQSVSMTNCSFFGNSNCINFESPELFPGF